MPQYQRGADSIHIVWRDKVFSYLEGIRVLPSLILYEYCAHRVRTASGTVSGITAILEVCESGVIKNLATRTSSCGHFDSTTTVSATAICGTTISIADTALPLCKPLAW